MKLAPVMRALNGRARQLLVHTGQHYNANMSDIFFRQLGMPQPDYNLEVGSDTHARQTAAIMSAIEPVLLETRPDLVLVYGDVNSTVAAALVCSKIGVPVGHVEAGLRSFDRTMPEEINRLLTDQIAELLFTPSQDGDRNLAREGVSAERIRFVGNVMIDTLLRLLEVAVPRASAELPDRYALVTLHRPSNVDDPPTLARIVAALDHVADLVPVLFPIHPRTRKKLAEIGNGCDRLHLMEPLGYLEFLALQKRATVVITDSGGIQEETTYLRVPCLTLRKNTERPITVALGTNRLIGDDFDRLPREVDKIIGGDSAKGQIPPLWDGHAAERIAQVICSL